MILPMALILCFTVSCQNKAKKVELEQYKVQIEIEKQNVAVVRQFFETVDTQNVNRLTELLALGAVIHGAVP